ncbi:TPA: HK97 family phage prohead protease [Clostridioides difficile]|nr:HK97 family phage prohead protease [Clostridioides difficile]
MKSLELRANDITLTSTENDNKLVVEGYVNETEKWSYKMRSKKGPFIEKIEKGAFKRALDRGLDIHFLAEHDSNKILASTRNGSLTLKEDDKGLLMRATISKTSYGKDYYELIKDGILRNMSFGFNVIKDSWKQGKDGTLERSIKDLNLFEVSVVTNPAYPASNIQSRGMDLVEEVEVTEIREEKKDISTLNEYRERLKALQENREYKPKEKKEDMKIEERATTQTNTEVVGATNKTIDIMEEVVGTSHILNYVRKKFVDRNKINEHKEMLVQSGLGKAIIVEEGQATPLDTGIGNYKGINADYKRYSTAERISQKFINDVNIQEFVEIPFATRIYEKIATDVVTTINTGATKKVTGVVDKTLINNMYKALPKKYMGGAIFIADENTYNVLDELYGNSNMDYLYGMLTIKGIPVVPVEIETETLQLANLNRCVQVNLEEQPMFKNTQDTVEAIRGTRVFESDLYAAIELADLDSVVVKGE